MTPEEMADLVHLRRSRDFIDRNYAQPLDVPSIARAACMSAAHFSRNFRAVYGETPSRYRGRDHHGSEVIPSCVSMVATRPRRRSDGFDTEQDRRSMQRNGLRTLAR